MTWSDAGAASGNKHCVSSKTCSRPPRLPLGELLRPSLEPLAHLAHLAFSARPALAIGQGSESTQPKDLISYNTLISACGRVNWPLALWTFAELQSQQLQPDLFSYGAVLSVCTGAEASVAPHVQFPWGGACLLVYAGRSRDCHHQKVV